VSGLFTLSATIAETSTNFFNGVGFFNSGVGTAGNFTNGSVGQGFLIYRNGGELDGFAGPGSGNGVDGPDAQTGDQLLTIVLDLTTHDNTTDFGSISFYQGSVDPGNLIGSHTYTSDQSFDAVGFSTARSETTLSNFQLDQVPEPGSLALLGLGGLLIARHRRD